MELIGQEIKTGYRFFGFDKYERAMFEVNDDKLWELFRQCEQSDRKVSLFVTDETELIMIVSNHKEDTLEGYKVFLREFNGALRFYSKNSVWQTL